MQCKCKMSLNKSTQTKELETALGDLYFQTTLGNLLCSRQYPKLSSKAVVNGC